MSSQYYGLAIEGRSAFFWEQERNDVNRSNLENYTEPELSSDIS